MKKSVTTTEAPAGPGFFSQAVQIGSLVQISGQGPQDPASGDYVFAGDIARQTTRTLENLRSIVEASGGSFDDVMSMRVYLTHQASFGEMNEAYEAFVRSNCPSGVFPARTTIFVGLPNPAMLVEIDAMAVVGAVGAQ